MVDPVNNRGYYEYRRVNTKTGTGLENGEKFSLDQEHAEKDSDKKEDKTKVEAEGVIAEFSSQSQGQYGGVGSERKSAAKKAEDVDFSQTMERVRGFIGELVKTVADFFSSVKSALLDFWNSDSGGTAADGGETAADSKSIAADGGAEPGNEDSVIDVTEMSQKIDGEAGIDIVEAAGVIERAADRKPNGVEERRAEAERYLDNEEKLKRYVKNSDLLTYYDRSGKLVQMNGADKNRILHGDSRMSRGV